jgi:antitoxin (DNA-binding transcriptional repressor) of toxin-antitoxin stability system
VATYRISEAEAAREFPGLMARVRAGVEVVIESGEQTVAVLLPPAPQSRTIEESIALLPVTSTAVMDDDFARDVEEAISAHREPLDPPAWD